MVNILLQVQKIEAQTRNRGEGLKWFYYLVPNEDFHYDVRDSWRTFANNKFMSLNLFLDRLLPLAIMNLFPT